MNKKYLLIGLGVLALLYFMHESKKKSGYIFAQPTTSITPIVTDELSNPYRDVNRELIDNAMQEKNSYVPTSTNPGNWTGNRVGSYFASYYSPKYAPQEVWIIENVTASGYIAKNIISQEVHTFGINEINTSYQVVKSNG